MTGFHISGGGGYTLVSTVRRAKRVSSGSVTEHGLDEARNDVKRSLS